MKKLNIDEEMVGLYHTIESLLQDKEKIALQFIGSHKGEGTTTLTNEFARIAADTFKKSVLLIDYSAARTLSSSITEGGSDLLKAILTNQISFDQLLSRHGNKNYAICPVSNLGESLQLIFSSPLAVQLIEKFKSQFDFILIDSPPATTSSDGVACARRVDGIIIVVEAEATRWPVIENVKTRFEKVGGNILGVIFNKKRYYIPDFIYRKL